MKWESLLNLKIVKWENLEKSVKQECKAPRGGRMLLKKGCPFFDGGIQVVMR
jgi:hypothetical protein